MRTVLVTGGSGFVGGALLKQLSLQENLAVRAAIRAEVTDLPDKVESVKCHDLAGDNDWSEALSGVSVVVHAAARAHVIKDDAIDPLGEFRRVNVDATLNLARQAAEARVKRLVFISSIGVNGNCSLRPFTEDDVLNPTEPFSIAKFEAETGLQDLSTETGMEVTIIRPPLVYGPAAPGNFGRLLHWVESGVPLPLGAVRNNHRSLVALDNLVDLIVTCIEHPAAANQVFLAGDGEDLSTVELLRRLAQTMAKPAHLIPVPVWLLQLAATLLGKRETVQRLCGSLQVDISKARELLGWVPPISVGEGLRRAVAPLIQGKVI